MTFGAVLNACRAAQKLEMVEGLLKASRFCEKIPHLFQQNVESRWWFQIFYIFTSIFWGFMIQFDQYSSVGLKPPSHSPHFVLHF